MTEVGSRRTVTRLGPVVAVAVVCGMARGAGAEGPGRAPSVTPPPVPVALRDADARRNAYRPVGAVVAGGRLDLEAAGKTLYDDNVRARSQGNDPALVGNLAVRATWRVENDAYDLDLDGRAEAVTYQGLSGMDHMNGALSARFAMTGWDRSHLRLEGGWTRRHDLPGDPDLPGGATAPVVVDVWAVGGDLLARRGMWLAGAEGHLRRLNYYDGKRVGGGPLDQDGRDRWDMKTALRAGLGPTPWLDVYGAVEESARVYDRPTDVLGYRRDSSDRTAWLGLRIERSERLALEAAGGRTRRDFVFLFFAPETSMVWRGAVTFAATPLTTVSGAGWQRLEETAAVAYSAVRARGWQVGIDHELLRNLVLHVLWRTERRDYLGPGPERDDRRMRVELGADWRLDHHWALGVEVLREAVDASIDRFDMTRQRFGLRLSVAL